MAVAGHGQGTRRPAPGDIVLALCVAGWVAGLAIVLSHRIFVTNDSLNNYAHVWYASARLYDGHGLPLHMPVLAHGEAFAFPYAFLPWAVAAVLRPVFGDWVVTLSLVVGMLALIGATFWAFPELRRGWWAALVLVDPFLIEAPLLGQLPFVWAAALLLVAVGCWRRDRRLLALLAAGLAQATHPAVLLPQTGLVVAIAFLCEAPRRRELVLVYVASLVIAAPAVYFVVASPTTQDASTPTLVINLIGTVLERGVVIALPLLLAWLQRDGRAPAPALFVLLLLANPLAYELRGDQYGWGALARQPDAQLQPFFHSPEFVPGATYRLLRAGDGKVAMYQLLRAGGRLDSEFFPESIDRRSFASTAAYAAFLDGRDVDYVLITPSYDAGFRTNEHDLLRQLAAPVGTPACATSAVQDAGFELYRIDRAACATVAASPTR